MQANNLNSFCTQLIYMLTVAVWRSMALSTYTAANRVID